MHRSLKRRLAGTAVAAAGLLVAGLAGPAQAASQAPSAAHAYAATATSHYAPPAGIASPCAATTSSAASCAVLTGTPAKTAVGAAAGRSAAAGTTTITGYTPTDLQAAYEVQGGFPGSAAGSGETVAVVTAYDDPDAASDLATYRSEYGLLPCTVADRCFEKVSETGSTTDLPPSSSGWTPAASESMDMISALCPNCHILLVEANSPSIDDLGTAVNEAVTLGAQFVDNDWYKSEASIGSAETTYDSEYFDHPGVAITAPAGDGGYGVNYPAASPYVIAVGGTTLTADSSSIPSGYTQTAWTGSGSGCSAYEPKPSWQTDTSGCAGRTVNDLAADADPDTPVAYYDTPTEGGWAADGGGGTAVAAAIVAALYAMAGPPAANTWPAQYPYEHPGGSYTTPGNAYPYIDGLDNITAETGGVTETCSPAYLCNAGDGYNGPTGLGAPFTTLSLTSTGGESGVIYGGQEGICVDNNRGITTPGNVIQIYHCNGGVTQDWIAEPDGTIRYAPDTSECMYITLAATQDNAPVELNNCSTADGGMQWIPLSNGTYYNPRSAKCLYNDGGTTNSTQLEILGCNSASRTEMWNVPYSVSSATGAITSDLGNQSQYCVDDYLDGTTSNDKIDLYACNGTPAQVWTVEPNGTMSVSGGCMSLYEDGQTIETKVVWSGCSGDASQRWIERSDGSLYNWFSSACLDDSNASTTNGNPLQIYTCNGGTNQEWYPPNF
jgi:hypothetical protein